MAEAAGHLITGPSQFQFNLPVGRFVAKIITLEGVVGWGEMANKGNNERRRPSTKWRSGEGRLLLVRHTPCRFLIKPG